MIVAAPRKPGSATRAAIMYFFIYVLGLVKGLPPIAPLVRARLFNRDKRKSRALFSYNRVTDFSRKSRLSNECYGGKRRPLGTTRGTVCRIRRPAAATPKRIH